MRIEIMRYVIISFALLLLLSCGAASQVRDSVNYFPLHVGDYWWYSGVTYCPPDSSGDKVFPFYEIKVLKTVLINGKQYFIVDHYFLGSDTIRTDEDGNTYLYNWAEERLFYNRSIAPGDSWYFIFRSGNGYKNECIGYLLSNNDTIVTQAGTFVGCLKYNLKIINVIDAEYTDFLAPNVGLVFRCVQESIELNNAVVDGLKYPRTEYIGDPLKFESNDVSVKLFPSPVGYGSKLTLLIETVERSFIQMYIYDMLGRKVTTIAESELHAGVNQYQWDSIGLNGEHVPPGVYTVVYSVRGTLASHKIVVIN